MRQVNAPPAAFRPAGPPRSGGYGGSVQLIARRGTRAAVVPGTLGTSFCTTGVRWDGPPETFLERDGAPSLVDVIPVNNAKAVTATDDGTAWVAIGDRTSVGQGLLSILRRSPTGGWSTVYRLQVARGVGIINAASPGRPAPTSPPRG